MATNYPTGIDGSSTLYSPVDAFSTKPLETTANGAIGAGDSTINVPSTMGGFAATFGILSIDDELIVYTAKTATQFTGCQRGAFGTVAASHLTGVPVKANMVSGFITALQSAVLAIENELGTTAARNYVLKNGAVIVATCVATAFKRQDQRHGRHWSADRGRDRSVGALHHRRDVTPCRRGRNNLVWRTRLS